MRRLVLLCFVAWIACGSRSPEQKLFDELDASTSWMAALQFAGEKWIANSVPGSFVRDAAVAAEPQLRQGVAAVDASDAPKEFRDALRKQIEISGRAAAALKEAAERGDRAAAPEIVGRLAAANAAVRRLQRGSQSS